MTGSVHRPDYFAVLTIAGGHGTLSGAFNSHALPSLSVGLAGNTNNLSRGVLSVVPTTPTNWLENGNTTNLNLSRPARHPGWWLQVPTNLLAVGHNSNWWEAPGASLPHTVALPVDFSVKPVARDFNRLPARFGHRNLAASFPSCDRRIESC